MQINTYVFTIYIVVCARPRRLTSIVMVTVVTKCRCVGALPVNHFHGYWLTLPVDTCLVDAIDCRQYYAHPIASKSTERSHESR
jgi:hypothetical protein